MTVDDAKTKENWPLAFNVFKNSQFPRLIMQTARVLFRIFIPEKNQLQGRSLTVKKIAGKALHPSRVKPDCAHLQHSSLLPPLTDILQCLYTQCINLLPTPSFAKTDGQ